MWMPVALLVLTTATAVAVNTGLALTKTFSAQVLTSGREHAVREVGDAVESFLLANSRYPLNLQELLNSPQYSELTGVATDIDYVVVTKYDSLMDRDYQKAIVFIKPDRYVDNTTWLSLNDCGTGSWSTSTQWCRKDGGIYAQTDSRAYQSYLAQETIVRLDYLAQQIFNGRTLTGRFPKTLASGNEMGDGSVTTLTAAVGYTGTAQTCSGVFVFDGSLISCEALYSLTGTPVYYQRDGNASAILYVDLPLKLASGEPHRVVRPLRIL